VKQVHQHRLAAAYPAPEIGSADRLGLAEQLEQAARRFGLELALEPVEARRRRSLLGVGTQLAGRDERFVPRKHSAHQSRGRIASYWGRDGSNQSQATASLV
jgi:hypothetical protein